MQIVFLMTQQFRTMPPVDIQLNQGKFEARCPITRRNSSAMLCAEARVAPPFSRHASFGIL
ncbi:hypothetical protein I6G79_20120 [Burkholderia plantarii]|nr:hypothetical protein [Burkholderia plantarii]